MSTAHLGYIKKQLLLDLKTFTSFQGKKKAILFKKENEKLRKSFFNKKSFLKFAFL